MIEPGFVLVYNDLCSRLVACYACMFMYIWYLCYLVVWSSESARQTLRETVCGQMDQI